VIVRTARPAEAAAVGDLRVSAYQAQHLLTANPGYAGSLRALGFGGHGTVLVAVGGDGQGDTDGPAIVPAPADGRLLGTVMYEPWHPGSEVARRPDEAEVRALAVAPQAQGQGVGRALMRAVIDQACSGGVARLLLSTQPAMKAAQHLYRSLGFARAPELDWTPVPGVTLLGFALSITRNDRRNRRNRA
jgi:ribosomal protein S18 acetylase RimI-like enzyme